MSRQLSIRADTLVPTPFGTLKGKVQVISADTFKVELYTGEKTILQYLTKPLYKSREAFREP
jgi:hypothetical protein